MSKGVEIIDVGGVNCYLLEADDGFVLIDTGFSTKRMFLDEVLKKALNKPGEVPKKLKLVILTHGDSDHAGNCKFLRENYGAKIAMHFEDSKMVENGDMSWNRKLKPDKISFTFRLVTLAFGKNSVFDTFKPDIYLQDGQNLAEFGLSAKVIHLPGHSKAKSYSTLAVIVAVGSIPVEVIGVFRIISSRLFDDPYRKTLPDMISKVVEVLTKYNKNQL